MENKANLMISLAIFSFNIPGQTQLQLHNLMVEAASNPEERQRDCMIFVSHHVQCPYTDFN